MHHLNISPSAAVGLFIAHRSYQPKGVDQMRAALDAERLFLREGDAGLVKLVGEGIASGSASTTEVILENHVYEHLKRAITGALDEGKAFGFTRGQASPLHATEAFDAIEKAEKRDAIAAPKLVDKPEKRLKTATSA